MKEPIIPPKRDYVLIKAYLKNGQAIIGAFCRRWGFRDANFSPIVDIERWEYYARTDNLEIL